MRHPWLKWAALALGAAVAFGGAAFMHAEVRDEARASFRATAGDITNAIETKTRAYADVLYALRGLMDASDHVSRDEFHRFAVGLALDERYPGVTNISFSPFVRHEKRGEFERAVRAEKSPLLQGLPRFAIKPPGDRPDYTVLSYVEPMGKNVAAWGLDLTGDPVRRAAVERARDAGAVASTTSVTLLRDTSAPIASTLLRLAVYRGGGVPLTMETRRQSYLGVVGSTLRVGEMMTASLSNETLAEARVRVYEPAEGGKRGKLLWDSAGEGKSDVPNSLLAYQVGDRVRIGDREWQILVAPVRDPIPALDYAVVSVVFLTLLTASLLLFSLIGSLATSETRGVELAKRNRDAALLRELGDNLQSCLALGEAYEVIGRHMPKLLPGTAGSVFVFDASRSYAEACSRWGEPVRVKEILSPDDCQSLRRGRLYHVADSAKGQNCAHFSGDAPDYYVCVPLTAQSELIGMMHMQRSLESQSLNCSEEQLNLINTAAEEIALAIANLGLRERLQEQAMRDHLTGLYNRHYTQEWLELEMRRAQRHGRPLSAIMLDVDHFKRFNDTFGHEAGDKVLQDLAGALKGSARGSDVVSRHGGEEFLLLLPECPFDFALRKAEDMRQQIENLGLEYDGRSLGQVTASLGVAAFPEHAQDADSLLRCADEAMYTAKQAGRNRVVAYSEGKPSRAASALPT